MQLPDKAIIIARLKKKESSSSMPTDDKDDKSDKLSDIVKDLLDALKNKDVEAIRDFLCEFIDAHQTEESDEEESA